MDPTGGLVKPAQVVGQLPSSYTGLVITFYFYFYLGGDVIQFVFHVLQTTPTEPIRFPHG
jgi:hypothetical protein